MTSYLRRTSRTKKDNQFTPLIDGERTYGRLAECIKKAQKFIYLASWNTEPQMELTRSGSGAGSVLRNLLLERSKAGVEVKVLTWDHATAFLPKVLHRFSKILRNDLRKFGNDLEKSHKLGLSALILDRHLHSDPSRGVGKKTGSHHQKFWLLDDDAKDTIGFVGGLNLGQHEWDTTEHIVEDPRRTKPGSRRKANRRLMALKRADESWYGFAARWYLRRQLKQALGGALERMPRPPDGSKTPEQQEIENLASLEKQILEYVRTGTVEGSGKPLASAFTAWAGILPPRHDVFSEVRGPIVRELHSEFLERWEMARRKWAPKAPELRSTFAIATKGETTVQVGHTSFAKKPGDPRDIRSSYRHAIERARKYIYLENQYFVSKKLAGYVAKRLRENPTLQVLIVVPNKAEDFAIGPAISLRLYRMIALLRGDASYGGASPDRVQLLTLVKQPASGDPFTPVYVHAKVAIIDDRFLTIGSANGARRSLAFDTELNSFVDDEAAARSFRTTLWGEHLSSKGYPAPKPEELADPKKAIELIRTASRVNQQINRGDKRVNDAYGRLLPIQFVSHETRVRKGQLAVRLPRKKMWNTYEKMARAFL